MSDRTRKIGDAIKRARADKSGAKRSGKDAAAGERDEELPLPASPDIELGPLPTEITLTLKGSAVGLARAALVDRVGTLEGLASANTKKGYPRQGRVVHADALTIREHILPKLGAVVELGLHTPQEVRAGVAEAFRPILAPFIKQRGELETVLGDLADRVERFCRGVSDRSFAQGHSARELTAEVAMVKSLPLLAASREGGE